MRPKFVVADGQPGTWLWRLVAEDGEEVGRSTGSFTSPGAAERAAESARDLASTATVTRSRDARCSASPMVTETAAVAPEADPAESMDVVIRRLVQASRARTEG